jgi:hypothetical protein
VLLRAEMADQLEDLLRACTVRVTGGAAPGAGFFIAPRKVLTCVHVIADSTALVVRWERDGQPALEAEVSGLVTVLADRGRPIPALDCDYPDVAVLEVGGLDGHPCVSLDPEWPWQEDSFQVFGFPEEGGAVQLTPARLTYRGTHGTLPTAYLDLASDTIKRGMSGAAVLNLRSGSVCGVVVASKHPAHPDGALAVPWSAVDQDLADVLAANRAFHATDRRWQAASATRRKRLRFQLDTVVHAVVAPADVQKFDDLLAEPMVGREWLVEEVDAFCQEHDRGYFLIEGDAGMGKTTFAAWLAQKKNCPAHFAQLNPDAGTTTAAVRNIGGRLIADWDLAGVASGEALPRDTDGAHWLRAVFQAAARRRDEIDPGKPIVIVVDALEAAAEHSAEHLPLGLPGRLPRGVYVVATVRTGGLRHDPRQHAPGECVWRRLDQARHENIADLRQYLSCAVNEERMADAITCAGVSPERFIELLLDRSLGVWIYARYVLEEIKQHPENAGTLPQLPRGLQAYYHNNLARLCDGADGSLHLRLLATLVVAAEYIDAPTLAALADVPDRHLAEYALEHALRPYCSIRRAPGEPRRRFKIRHPSLSEYVAAGPILDASGAGAAGQPDDPLRERLAAAWIEAHYRIAEHYLTAWGGLDQGGGLDRSLPDLQAAPERGAMDGGYPLRRMATHLLATGRQADLHHLLACGRRGSNTWFAAHDSIGDTVGYLRDVSDARNAAERLSMHLRYALLSASVTSLASRLPPALAEELVARMIWSAPRAFSHIERMTNEQRQSHALARIAPRLPVEFLGPALSVAMRCQKQDSRLAALQALIPHLHGGLLERAVDAFFAIGHSSPEMLVAVAKSLPRDLLLDLDRRHGRNYRPREYLRASVAFFSAEDRSQGARNALAAATQLDTHHERGLLVAALVPYFHGELFDEVLAVLSEADRDRSRYIHPALTALARYCPPERLGDLLDFTADRAPESEFFREAAPRLTADQMQTALQLCQAEQYEVDRVRIFIELSPYLDASQARKLLAPPPEGPEGDDPLRRLWHLAVGEFLQLFDRRGELPVVGMLLERLPEPEASAKLADLMASHAFDQPATRMADLFSAWPDLESPLILERQAKYLPGDLRQRSLTSISEDIRDFTDRPREKALRLAQFAPFSQAEVAAIFDIVKEAWWPEADVIVGDVLAPHLHDDRLVRYAASRVTAYPLEEECFAALGGLGAFQTPTARDRTAKRALALADGISYRGKKARAVAALAPILLHPDVAAQAFEIAQSTGPYWMAQALDPLAPALPVELLQAIPDAINGPLIPDPALDIPRTLERLSREGRTASMDCLLPCLQDPQASLPWREAKKIMHLAPYLSPPQAQRLWHIGDPEILHPEQAEALSALARRLPERERAAAVDELLAAYKVNAARYAGIERTAWFLGQLAQAASTEQLTQILHELLTRYRGSGMTSTVLQELVPGLPDTLLNEAFNYAVSGDFEPCLALAAMAPRLSGALLTQAISFLNNTGFPGKASALVALSGRLPAHDREAVLNLALETALSWPYKAWQEGVMADLIPRLPEGMRAQAVDAFTLWACDELRRHQDNQTLDKFRTVLSVLRGPELEHLYSRLGKEVKSPQMRAGAQAAVLRKAAQDNPASFADGWLLYQDWPGDFDRAALMDLIGASAWWIYRNGNEPAIEETIEAIFDNVRWWPG